MSDESVFQEITLERDRKRVVWEYIGEGLFGDYDPEDPLDRPLLRFSCNKWDEEGKEWVEIPDSSYCTRMPKDTPYKKLILAMAEIMEALELPSPRRRLQELSWICPKDFATKPGGG